MSLDTYTNLKSELASWLERDDLGSQIDTFIDLFEAKMNRDLRLRSMIKRARASMSTSVRYLALPADYLAMRVIRIINDPVNVLTRVNDDEITRYWNSAGGVPQFYTIHEEIEFDRVADSAYSLEMVYYARFTALSSSNETNTLLTIAPDLYLWGTLVCAEPYLDNDNRIPTWKTLADEALASVKAQNIDARYGAGPLISKTRGDRP